MASQDDPITILLAASRTGKPGLADIEATLRASSLDGRAIQVQTVDLDQAPPWSPVRALVGIGWHARTIVRTAERETGHKIDALVEVHGGNKHLLGLGRVRCPSVRIADPTAVDRPRDIVGRIERIAALEGATLAVPVDADAGSPPRVDEAGWERALRLEQTAQVRPLPGWPTSDGAKPADAWSPALLEILATAGLRPVKTEAARVG